MMKQKTFQEHLCPGIMGMTEDSGHPYSRSGTVELMKLVIGGIRSLEQSGEEILI